MREQNTIKCPSKENFECIFNINSIVTGTVLYCMFVCTFIYRFGDEIPGMEGLGTGKECINPPFLTL